MIGRTQTRLYLYNILIELNKGRFSTILYFTSYTDDVGGKKLKKKKSHYRKLYQVYPLKVSHTFHHDPHRFILIYKA